MSPQMSRLQDSAAAAGLTSQDARCRVVLILCGFVVAFRAVTVLAICKLNWQTR